MKNNWRHLRRAGLLMVLLVSSTRLSIAGATQSPSPGAAAGSQSEADVRALLPQLTDAYNRGDARGASATFTQDGDLITGAGDHLAGPNEIETFLSGLIAKLPKGTRFLATITNVRFAGPDVAVLTSEGGWLYPGEASISDKNQGIQSVVAVHRDGVWRIALFQRTRTTPPPAATK